MCGDMYAQAWRCGEGWEHDGNGLKAAHMNMEVSGGADTASCMAGQAGRLGEKDGGDAHVRRGRGER